MKKIKILHITSSLKIGGAERMLVQLVQRSDFEHVVLYFHAGPFVEALRECGIPVVQIKGLVCRYDPLFFWRLLRTIIRQKPDVLHAMLWAANVCARICACIVRKPLITAYHNNITQDGFVRSFLDHVTCSLSDKHIAVSKEVAQSVIARTPQAASMMEIIPNGIRLPDRRKRATVLTREDLALSHEVFIVGAVGRFVRLKRFDLLIEAFASVLKNASGMHLMLIGTGPEEMHLRTLVQLHGIKNAVTFVTEKEARLYIPLFDCFVQTSDNEGISIALLEAMSFHLPCIVMGKRFEHAVIAHNEDGLVCEPGDKEMLVRYIPALKEDAERAKRIGYNGFMKVKSRFNEQNMIAKYAKVFKDLAKEKYGVN